MLMASIRRGFAVLLAVLAVIATPRQAEAVSGLSFEAPSGCPSEAQFLAAVAARGGDFERLRSGGTNRSIEISIGGSGSGFHGSLRMRDGDDATDPREVHADSCGAVVDGLAVVTAIALGGHAEAATAGPNGGVAARPLAVLPQPPPEDTSLHDTNGFGTHSIRVDAGKVDVDRVLSASVAGGFVGGLVPGLTLPRYDLDFSTANFFTSPDDRHYLVGAVIGIHASFLGTGTYRTADSATDVYGSSWGVDICRPWRYDTRGLVLLSCGEFTGGQLNFDTHDLVAGKTLSKSAGFGQFGINVQLQYNLARYVHANLRAGGDLAIGSPLQAERADGSEVFSSSRRVSLSGYLMAGIGFHF
jgi:hypothetical protein